VAACGVLFLAGCGGMLTTAGSGAGLNQGGTLGGSAYAGQQAIAFATVKLWSAGYTGYGSAASLLATTTTANDGIGTFTFVKSGTNGSSSVTGNTWACPVSGNPQIYITVTSGNTTGNGLNNSANKNTAIELVSALGPCSGVTNSEYVYVDEYTTAATVFALAQYINPGTTPGTFSIGTSSTTQGATGLNNAVASIANLASILQNGALSAAPTYTGSGAAAGITVTATAESTKLATIADALATCVNNQTAPNTSCTQLFAGAVPPVASVTSQPGATFGTAQDTVQAAYYMATNPAGNGAVSSTCTAASQTTNIGCIYALVTANSPYATSGSLPTDWTIGVTYTASGTCPGGGSFISGPYHAGVDASGNIWFVNGGATSVNLSEMSVIGQPLFCAGDLAAGRGMTIDSNGNVWASFNGTTTANNVMLVPNGSTTPVYTAISASFPAPYTMTADGAGNVFINENATGGSLLEWVAPSTTAPGYPTTIASGFNGTTAATLGYVQVDTQGRIWDSTSTVEFLYEIYPPTTITAYAVSGGTVTFTSANTFAVGNTVEVNGLSTPEGLLLDNQVYTVTAATSTTFSAATSAATIALASDSGTAVIPAGNNGATVATAGNGYTWNKFANDVGAAEYGMAIDSNNYLYQGTTCCGTATPYRGAVKWTPGAVGTTPVNTVSTVDFGGINGVRGTAVDGAANFWLVNEYPNSSGATASTGNYSIVELTTSGSGTTATFGTLSPAGLATEPPATCSTAGGCATQGGFFNGPTDFLYPFDVEIDPSGNVWVTDQGTVEGNTLGVSISELVGAAVPVVTPLSIAVKNQQLGTKP